MTAPSEISASQARSTPNFADDENMDIFGVRVDNIDEDKAFGLLHGYMVDRSSDSGARSVYFTNVHSIHLSQKDPSLRRFISRADLALADGSGVSIAGKMAGNPIKANLNGTDLLPKLFGDCEDRGWTVYLFGAEERVLKLCLDQLAGRFPGLKIVGSHHGYVSEDTESMVIDEIKELKPDMLLVALGSPRQESWIDRHASGLPVGICFAVGGLFDFMSGEKQRAPNWMRRFGIEWLYRLAIEPKGKWDRTFVEMPLFLTRVFLARFAPQFVTDFINRRIQTH
ncbi:MAG: WecB/TagA/CpsF family glycosyltransferase [Candidatus Latescibacteria bacterium]|jgi:N-acetylglucosaminyldiphosphoundecaprenol N-acetyl-beta-D-mannosaminyltransferase|nr:WecB/TagA/CpsF family glycosyltransferase [Candidatus Latescibacterota bacterium]